VDATFVPLESANCISGFYKNSVIVTAELYAMM